MLAMHSLVSTIAADLCDSLCEQRACTCQQRGAKSVRDGCRRSEVGLILQQRLLEALEGHVCRHGVEATEAAQLSGCAQFCRMKRDAVTIWQQFADVLEAPRLHFKVVRTRSSDPPACS